MNDELIPGLGSRTRNYKNLEQHQHQNPRRTIDTRLAPACYAKPSSSSLRGEGAVVLDAVRLTHVSIHVIHQDELSGPVLRKRIHYYLRCSIRGVNAAGRHGKTWPDCLTRNAIAAAHLSTVFASCVHTAMPHAKNRTTRFTCRRGH